ncbi:MAG: glycosyltransferase family 2 protein, partial [Candidatus Limnocylindria bacterium]
HVPLSASAHRGGYRTLRGAKLDEAGNVMGEPWSSLAATPDWRLPPEKQPFVSVQIATYNERTVMDRLLSACTALDYQNYEVMICDDSTDPEALRILDRWRDHPRVRVLHRPTRAGFKGGALQEGLRRMNPRAEYVLVFDADFVPPADVVWHFLEYFGRLGGTANGNGHAASGNGAERRSPYPSHYGGPDRRAAEDGHLKYANGVPQNGERLAAVQGYQWHMLNAGENWVTKGVRAEFAGSYVLERAGQELFGAMKMISGSVYMIRADVLRRLGWSTSITEDWELTIRLYLAGYKVLYTPYIQAPAECVSTIRRLVKQRMRWAEGHTFNVRKYFWQVLRSPNLSLREKLEFLYYAPYYLQAVFFGLGTAAWLISTFVLGHRLPVWGEVLGWSLVVTNILALPLMNLAGVLLEGSLRRDALGLLSFVGLSTVLVPFQAYAALRGLLEREEGGWVRTPKSGHVTEAFASFRLARLFPWELPRRRRQRRKVSRAARLGLATTTCLIGVAVVALTALSVRAAAAGGALQESDYALPAALGAGLPLALLAFAHLRLRRRLAVVLLAFCVGLSSNVVFLANAVPAAAVTDNSNVFTFKRTSAFAPPALDMEQSYTPAGAGTTCPAANGASWTCDYASDTFTAGQSMSAGTATVHTYLENNVDTIVFRAAASQVTPGNNSSLTVGTPAGTAQGDVMVAAIAVQGGSSATVTAPSGWTLVRRTDNSTTIALAVYRKVAGPSEPASHTWTFGADRRAAGGISAYSGVDTASPVDVEGGQSTSSGTSHATPSVTTTVANARVVTAHAAHANASWTPPAGMTERFDRVSSGGPQHASVEGNDAAQAAAGATGTKAATSSSSGVGVTHILALRPAPRTCDVTVQVLHNTTVLGSGTASITSPSSAAGTLVTTNIATPAVAYATGDRLRVTVAAPSDTASCAARLHYDGASVPSRLVTATIVPEGALPLLLLALGAPVALRAWRRR